MACSAPLLRPEQFERYRRHLDLQRQRFTDVAAFWGGIEAWSLAVDPEVQRY